MSPKEADMRAELTRLRTALAAILLALEVAPEFQGRRQRPLVMALISDIVAILRARPQKKARRT